MFKIMLFASTMFQLFISTTIELLGNERGNVVVDPVPPVVDPQNPEPPKADPKPNLSKNDLLRELSKEHGINLFDAEGIAKFKEFQASQKSELEKAQEIIEGYKTKETEWQTKQIEFASKLKASELGIPQDKLEDALKLAGGNPDNLEEVIKKYPIFTAGQKVKIGLQQKDQFQDPQGLSEMEKYMAQNPHIYKTKK